MGTRSNRLVEAVLTSNHNLCFEQKYETISEFLPENFHFLVVKFSVYLNRHVFIMIRHLTKFYFLVTDSNLSACLIYLGMNRCLLLQHLGEVHHSAGYIISFGITEPILVTLEIKYCLSRC